MEDKERENLPEAAKTHDLPSDSGTDGAPEKATEQDAGTRRRKANKQQIKDLDSDPSLQGSFPWMVGAIVLLLGLIASGLLYLGIHRQMHLSDLKPYVGTYAGCLIKDGALEIDARDERLILRKRGKASFRRNGEESEGKWDLKGERLTLKVDGRTCYGSLNGDLIRLTLERQEHIFLREGSKTDIGETVTVPTETEAPDMSTLPPSELIYSGWTGDYYGWWIRKDPGESWHGGQEFAFWDVCATVTPTAPDRAELEIWDSQCGPGERLCIAQVSFGPGRTSAGMMTADSGLFLDEELSPGAWSVDPGSEPIPRMLTIEGSTGSSDYLVFLRPWGMGWEDVNNYDGRFFADMMPAHYDDWYTSCMDGGMPDYFVGLVFPRVDRNA